MNGAQTFIHYIREQGSVPGSGASGFAPLPTNKLCTPKGTFLLLRFLAVSVFVQVLRYSQSVNASLFPFEKHIVEQLNSKQLKVKRN